MNNSKKIGLKLAIAGVTGTILATTGALSSLATFYRTATQNTLSNATNPSMMGYGYGFDDETCEYGYGYGFGYEEGVIALTDACRNALGQTTTNNNNTNNNNTTTTSSSSSRRSGGGGGGGRGITANANSNTTTNNNAVTDPVVGDLIDQIDAEQGTENTNTNSNTNNPRTIDGENSQGNADFVLPSVLPNTGA